MERAERPRPTAGRARATGRGDAWEPAGLGVGADQRQLRFLLGVTALTVALASVGLVGVYLALIRSGWILVEAATVGACSLGLVGALRLADQGRTDLALTVLALGNWLVAVITVTITPFILPMIALTVVLPAIAPVPHLSPRRMLATGAGAVAVSIAVTVLARLHLVTGPEEMAPDWLTTGLVVAFVPVLTGLIVLHAWRGHVGIVERARELAVSRTRIVAAGDRERRRIERDLHDGAQQGLTAVVIRLGVAQRLIATDPERASALLAELSGEVEATLTELRDLAHGIYPPLLSQRGLGEALAAAARRAPVATTVTADGVGRLPPELEAAVYFCCLEALQNATKHAGAGEVHIAVTRDRAVTFTVSDDGAGFDPARVTPGSGLNHMTDRLGAIGGTLRIDSTPGSGTVVRGRVPVDATAGS